MSYFDGIKTGDKVWSLLHGWGTVVKLYKGYFEVNYKHINGFDVYTLDGKYVRNNSMTQILFWDEIKFEIPKKSKIELKENKYYIDLEHNKITDKNRFNKFIDNDLFRNNKKIAEKALKTIKRFTRLLALRDQECEGSKGFEPNKDELYYVIIKEDGKYVVYDMFNLRTYDTIKFKSEADAQKICDILNEGRFDLEGE